MRLAAKNEIQIPSVTGPVPGLFPDLVQERWWEKRTYPGDAPFNSQGIRRRDLRFLTMSNIEGPVAAFHCG